MSPCQHSSLLFETFKSSKIAYEQPSREEIQEALAVSRPPRKKAKTSNRQICIGTEAADRDIALPLASTFPAPSVLPGDELFHDPECPAQSVQAWIDQEERNVVTKTRNTVYVVPPPSISDDIRHVNEWLSPNTLPEYSQANRDGRSQISNPVPQPNTDDVAEYLRAFYLGMQVKVLKKASLHFTAWESSDPEPPPKKLSASKASPPFGLSTAKETIRIRSRRSKDNIFTGQLNLNDLLDTAISILPKEAYALLMLVHHDLYEDDDDDFCCGRAYVGLPYVSSSQG